MEIPIQLNLRGFASKNGWELVLKDVQTHLTHIKEYSDAVFILGHSMGSFVAQEASD